jgi:hypothetical protein
MNKMLLFKLEVISLEVEINLMEYLTKELRNISGEWPQHMPEACVMAENIFPHISLT